MRSLGSSLIAVLMLAAAATGATASQVPTVFQSGRYLAQGAGASLSFFVQRSQVTRLQVRMPLSCRNTRTHRLSAPTLAFGAAGRPTTYSRIYLPADGSANVAFVADDNSRQPEIYLSLQLHGGIGHVSVHARSQAARETCTGELGFDVRALN
ncbi:MAG TPA: hypothetical protein VFD90_00370 [Gaiellales bacterium]|nr:hypothetical protein [Gaiellales bacterium]